jgi:hypothetical protein
MIIDRYTKSILTVIAVALMLNAVNPWIAPTKAWALDHSYAQDIIRGIDEISKNANKIFKGINRIAASIDNSNCNR